MNKLKEEKRLFPRVPLKLPLRYRILGQKNTQGALVRDISVVGVGFTCDKFIRPNTCIRFEIGVPVKVISPIGRVVWAHHLAHSDRYRIGVEFTKMNYSERCNLADCIDAYLFNTLKKG